MGIEGNFWGLLKPYARNENSDFLRNKKVAVDLSYWIVQQETALKNKARNPHLRLTFFRTILLFSKLGAFPVFVIDGVPSPLKARARAERFYRFTGIDSPNLSKMEDGVSVERNGAFQKCVRECVELLELLGMPVLKARCEAEALCAQLNYEGHVDACITADSDAFLYGAKCVIKCLRPNSKEPFECYWMPDIEAGLGLKREHLIAISLLAGNDHDLGGVSGIGIETALRFVQMYEGDDILKRLNQVGNGDFILFPTDNNIVGECDLPTSSEKPSTTKLSHCSCCGHPGSRKAHSKLSCELCIASGNEHCTQKPSGFKCECSACNLIRKNKEQKKHASWQLSVCRKISSEKNFPNNEIIEMYLSQNHGTFVENQIPSLSWGAPSVSTLVDFLWYHQHWDPSYIRQRMLPLLSTNFLREIASNPTEGLLLHGQYEFHSIQRVKVRYGQPCYVVKWRKAIRAVDDANNGMTTVLLDVQNDDVSGVSEAIDPLDDHDAPQILVDDDGCSFLLTEEHVELVQAAFPEKVARFLQEKEIKESKSPRKKTTKTPDGGDNKFVTPKSKSKPSGVQLSIKEFYRSSKILAQAKQEDDTSKVPVDQANLLSKEKRKLPTSNLSKSVRRRLLFQ